MPRRRVDLKRLPRWLQYAIALTVAAGVMLTAWRVGQEHPGPAWIIDYLIPVWQWVGVAVLFWFIVAWLVGRAKK